MINHTLLIWSSPDAPPDLFLIPDGDITPEHRAVLVAATGYMLNQRERRPEAESAVILVSDAIVAEGFSGAVSSDEYASIWSKYRSAPGEIAGVSITSVVVCGWV